MNIEDIQIKPGYSITIELRENSFVVDVWDENDNLTEIRDEEDIVSALKKALEIAG